jgi:hypothetical protein
MAKFLEEAKGTSYICAVDIFCHEQSDKTPLDRAILLEKTTLFANIHAEMASSGQTAVPQDLDTDLHFTCFVQAPTAASRQAGIETGEMHVIELDGTREGPINHGSIKLGEDFLGVRPTCFLINSSLINHLHRPYLVSLRANSLTSRLACTLI